MEEEIDIYADLPNFNLEDNDNLADVNKKISEKCCNLEKQVDDLTRSLESLRKINKNLEVNISSLLKTAKAEIARKDRMIATIRSELDNIQFRRGKYGRAAKSTRRSPPKKVTEIETEEETRPRVPEVIETTEIVPREVKPSVAKSVAYVNQGHRLDGIVNTVFGERLRKRILDSQEEERRKREEETKLKDEEGSRKNVARIDSLASECRPDGKRSSEDRTDANNLNIDSKKPDEDKYREEVGNDEADVGGKVGVNVGAENEIEDRHNRVAMRLLLLSEGIDPDVRSTDCARNEGTKIVEEKRQERKRNNKRSRSRSKSTSRDSKMKRRNNRSQSITTDEYYKSGRAGKQRDNRRRDSRERFDRRRDSKNKDADNLSEFSREIIDLKERFEHRIGDRAYDRTRRSGSYNRHKRNEEKFHRNGRSRTPDSAGSGGNNKERMAQRSRDDKRYRRSRSRERRKSRNSKDRDCNVDTASQHCKSVASTKTEINEGAEIIRALKESNAETKSLASLEDGEIVDSSANSSPKKSIRSIESSTGKDDIDSTNKSSSSDPPRVGLKDSGDAETSTPPRETGDIREPDRSIVNVVNDRLNSSKDERIENIAEFIANFSTDDEKLNTWKTNCRSIREKEEKEEEEEEEEVLGNKVERDSMGKERTDLAEEKLENLATSELKICMNDDCVDSVVSELNNGETITRANKSNDMDDRNEDWHLIAIDSPVKNFEENRHNRIMAISAQVMGNSEELTINSQVISPTVASRASESSEKILSEVGKTAGYDTPQLPLLPSENNAPITKPIVFRALRSIYRKGKKKMVLSDTNSLELAKITSTDNSSLNSQSRVPSKTDKNFNISREEDDEKIINDRKDDEDDCSARKDVGSTIVHSMNKNSESSDVDGVKRCEKTIVDIEDNAKPDNIDTGELKECENGGIESVRRIVSTREKSIEIEDTNIK